jgi:Rrf2 family protein
MIKLNRTTEYGLIALRHMSRKQVHDASVTSAREIADQYGLPFEITAKTLQRLKDTGLIHSAQGARGGYTLNKPLHEITLAQFLEMMEGPQAVVACAPAIGEKVQKAAEGSDACACEYKKQCEITSFMTELNNRVYRFLSGIRLADLADNPVKAGEVFQLSAQAGIAQEP